MITQDQAQRISTPVDTVPPQTRRTASAPAAERVIRQLEAIDAWNAARRTRERLLDAAARSRLDRVAAKRETDALLRTHQAIAALAAEELSREAGPMRPPGATAVIAHRHDWFAHRLALVLQAHGVAVIACTDNGAEALGAVVAEQPDILLAGDRLAMMSGEALIAESRLFAPATHRAVQASDPQHLPAWLSQADSVFLRHHPPGHVGEALGQLCRAARGR